MMSYDDPRLHGGACDHKPDSPHVDRRAHMLLRHARNWYAWSRQAWTWDAMQHHIAHIERHQIVCFAEREDGLFRAAYDTYLDGELSRAFCWRAAWRCVTHAEALRDALVAADDALRNF